MCVDYVRIDAFSKAHSSVLRIYSVHFSSPRPSPSPISRLLPPGPPLPPQPAKNLFYECRPGHARIKTAHNAYHKKGIPRLPRRTNRQCRWIRCACRGEAPGWIWSCVQGAYFATPPPVRGSKKTWTPVSARGAHGDWSVRKRRGGGRTGERGLC